MQRALFQHQKYTGYLYRILPKDAEAMTQVLDEYAVWKENGGDLQNIPDTIRPYYARLNTFFESMAEYLAGADPNFRARENYFMHLYDPEKLKDPQKAALARMLVDKQGYTEEQAVAAVQGLHASLLRVNQSPDPDKVTAHSSETRAWTELTYADLKELNVLYDSRTAIFKYVKEVTRAAEFHKVFGDGVVRRIAQMPNFKESTHASILKNESKPKLWLMECWEDLVQKLTQSGDRYSHG